MAISEIPYDDRTDDQKLESNWYKALKLYERGDWSACVVRIATSVEISANIYIREFYLNEYRVPPSIVDALLKSANGIDGKFNRLIRPIALHRSTWPGLRAAKSKIEDRRTQRS